MTVRPFNLTNPMMRKGPIREFLPLPAEEVAVRLPPGKRPRAQVAKGELRLRIPSILDREVVAVGW